MTLSQTHRILEKWLDNSSMSDFEPSSEDECIDRCTVESFLKLSREYPSLRSIQQNWLNGSTEYLEL